MCRCEQRQKKPQRGGSVLTVFGASDVGQDPEALGLQVGGTASPFRHVLGLSWPDHRLVNWGRTVHHGVLDRQSSAAGQTGLLRAAIGALGDARAEPFRCLKTEDVLQTPRSSHSDI